MTPLPLSGGPYSPSSTPPHPLYLLHLGSIAVSKIGPGSHGDRFADDIKKWSHFRLGFDFDSVHMSVNNQAAEVASHFWHLACFGQWAFPCSIWIIMKSYYYFICKYYISFKTTTGFIIKDISIMQKVQCWYHAFGVSYKRNWNNKQYKIAYITTYQEN